MSTLLGIALISGALVALIWTPRLFALRRGEVLSYHHTRVVPLLRHHSALFYWKRCHRYVLAGSAHLRYYVFIALRKLFLWFRALTLRLEQRLLALINLVRGRGVAKPIGEPSRFLREMKEYKNNNGTSSPA